MTHSRKTQQLFDLTGKITLVTGGERGLGRVMAENVAEAGSDVIINFPFLEEKVRAEDQVGIETRERLNKNLW